jgi:hypothetical protein
MTVRAFADTNVPLYALDVDEAKRKKALALEDRLKPPAPGEDSPEYSAWKLAEVLYELLADAALMNRLVDLLESDEARQATE